jgi:hypothetical protein
MATFNSNSSGKPFNSRDKPSSVGDRSLSTDNPCSLMQSLGARSGGQQGSRSLSTDNPRLPKQTTSTSRPRKPKPTNNSGKAKRKRQKFSKRERETTNPAMFIQACHVFKGTGKGGRGDSGIVLSSHKRSTLWQRNLLSSSAHDSNNV